MVWLALALQPVTQLCRARMGPDDDDSGTQGRQPPTSFFLNMAGLSNDVPPPPPPPASREQAQVMGLKSLEVRQSADTVLLDDEVLLEVEAVVERQLPRVFSPMAPLSPPRFDADPTPPGWAQEKEDVVLPAPPPAAGQLEEGALHALHRTSFQQPQLKGWAKSMVQVWSGLGKPPPRRDEQGDRGMPWMR